MHLRRFLLSLIVLGCASSTALAAILLPGKYTGVVIFDRWDGCILYGSVRFLYVSERVKHKLRPHAGQSVELDVISVKQGFTGYPGLIAGLDYIDPAPKPDPDDRSVREVEGLRLRAVPAFLDGDKPRLTFTIANETDVTRNIDADVLAFSLLTTNDPDQQLFLQVFDGPSRALMANQSIWSREALRSEGDLSRRKTRNDQIVQEWRYAWRLDATDISARTFKLDPGAARSVTIQFDLMEGEYDFLAGYGGNVFEHGDIASNLVAFDVDGTGAATLVPIDGR